MSASKKDQLLRNLTRRDAQKPPMDVTYENKGLVLDQMTERTRTEQNSKNANEQNSVEAEKQNSKDAEQHEFALAEEQTSATTEMQTGKDAKQQTSADTDAQNSRSTKEQNGKYANLRRITFHIPEELFRQLKLISVEEDLTMLEIGAQMAQEYVERKRGNAYH